MQAPEDAQAYALPEGFEDYEIESAGGLADTAAFERLGDMIVGDYLGTRTLKLGNREQTLYSFIAAPEMGSKDYHFGVWGSTVLDNRMLELSPRQGDRLLIRYIGDGKSAEKGNPPKIFQVARLKKKS